MDICPDGNWPTSSPAAPAWTWPLDPDRYRHHGRLSQAESDGLQKLGFELLRFDRNRDSQGWKAIRRLTAPLDDTQTVLHWHPDNRYQRRFARDAAAIVLHHCAELGRAFWAWSTHEWANLLHGTVEDVWRLVERD